MDGVNTLAVLMVLGLVAGVWLDVFEARRGRDLRSRILASSSWLAARPTERSARRLDRRLQVQAAARARQAALRDLRLFGTDGGLWRVHRLPGVLTQRLEVVGLEHRLVLDLYASFGRDDAAAVDGASLVSLRWSSTYGWTLCAHSPHTGTTEELHGPHLVAR
jgi:hypothetical protein